MLVTVRSQHHDALAQKFAGTNNDLVCITSRDREQGGADLPHLARQCGVPGLVQTAVALANPPAFSAFVSRGYLSEFQEECIVSASSRPFTDRVFGFEVDDGGALLKFVSARLYSKKRPALRCFYVTNRI